MELMVDIILGIMVITLILGMLSIIPMVIPMAIPVGLILIDALLYGIDTFTTKENEELT